MAVSFRLCDYLIYYSNIYIYIYIGVWREKMCAWEAQWNRERGGEKREKWEKREKERVGEREKDKKRIVNKMKETQQIHRWTSQEFLLTHYSKWLLTIVIKMKLVLFFFPPDNLSFWSFGEKRKIYWLS